jgi:hypothetical protein
MIAPQSLIMRKVCGAATRFLAWRAGNHLRAIDPQALSAFAHEAQEFAQAMRRLRGQGIDPLSRPCWGR